MENSDDEVKDGRRGGKKRCRSTGPTALRSPSLTPSLPQQDWALMLLSPRPVHPRPVGLHPRLLCAVLLLETRECATVVVLLFIPSFPCC